MQDGGDSAETHGDEHEGTEWSPGWRADLFRVEHYDECASCEGRDLLVVSYVSQIQWSAKHTIVQYSRTSPGSSEKP